MEEMVKELFDKFPIAATVYTILSGLYMVFCGVAALTKTDVDDKIADRFKRFFSLPVRR